MSPTRRGERTLLVVLLLIGGAKEV